jgi:hypothetical protein
MKKGISISLGIALIVSAMFITAGCSKKDAGSGDGASSAGAGSSGSAKAALKAIQGTDTAAIVQALNSLAPAAIAELTQKSGSPSGDFKYDLNATKDGIIIKEYTGAGGTVIVPEKIEGDPVVEIGDSSFRRHKVIAVVLPGGIKKIGESGFYGHGKLASINLPAGLQEIGKNAFAKTGLTQVMIPEGIQRIEETTFQECKRLLAVTLPASIKEIEDSAFDGCGELADITIPASVTALTFHGKSWDAERMDTFRGCGKLKLAVRKQLQDFGYIGSF